MEAATFDLGTGIGRAPNPLDYITKKTACGCARAGTGAERVLEVCLSYSKQAGERIEVNANDIARNDEFEEMS
jgi:hypothetical protein